MPHDWEEGTVPPLPFSSFGSLRDKHILCEPHSSWSEIDRTEQPLPALEQLALRLVGAGLVGIQRDFLALL